MLLSTFWAYPTLAKTTIGFTLFQLIYGIECVLLIECEVPSLKLVLEILPNTSNEEEHLIYLAYLDEHHRDVFLANETNKKHVKAYNDQSVRHQTFLEGNLVLVYDQYHDK